MSTHAKSYIWGAPGARGGPHLLDALVHVFQEAPVRMQAPERESLTGPVPLQSQTHSPALGVLLVCGRFWVPPFRLVDPGVQDIHLQRRSQPRKGSAPSPLMRRCPAPPTAPPLLYLRGWGALSLPLLQVLGPPTCSLELLDASILSHHGPGLRPRSGTAAGQPCPCPHNRAGRQAGPGDRSQPHIGIGGLVADGGLGGRGSRPRPGPFPV